MNTLSLNEAGFSLPVNLTVRAITVSHTELLKFIDANDTAMIKLADDAQIDISFIQMIEAARIYAGVAGKRVVLAEPASGPLLDVLRRSGFLEDMSAEDAKFWLHQGDIQ